MKQHGTNHRPGPLVGGPNPLEQRSLRKTTWYRRLLHAIGSPIIVGMIRALWASYRFTVEGEEPVRRLLADNTPLILTLWHDSIFVMAWYLGRLGRLGARVTFVISPSTDGDFAARVVAVMGGRAVRGSATRSGVKALHGLYRAIKRENASPVVLPDGPQGPRHHCKPGSLLLSQLAKAHILPMACAARRPWHLRTWDRQLVPVPFTRVAIVLGEVYAVPPGIDAEDFEAEREALQAELEQLGRAANEQLRR